MIIIVRGSKIPKMEPPNKISTIIEAIATGTDIKKLNFKACSCSYFCKRMVDTVKPEREIPGRIAQP